MCARKVTLVERASPNVRYQGRVSGMKDSFGFIKRSDVTGQNQFNLTQSGYKNNPNFQVKFSFITPKFLLMSLICA